MTSLSRFAFCVGAFAACSAGPPADPDELVRRGNEAVRSGDPAAAGELYAAAGERTADPGLVAFNAAAALFDRGEYREAEVHYLRALDDRAAPPARRARALYNRGVCLLKRGGDLPALRTAVLCFEQCLAAGPPDPGLAADARHNLELAKLLWNQARSREAKPPRPSEIPPEERFDDVPPPRPGGGDDPGADPAGRPNDPGGQPDVRTDPGTLPRPGGPAPQPAPQPAPGRGTLPVLRDEGEFQKLSPEDTRAYLDRIGSRLDRDRRASNQLRAGPERPRVRDW